MYHLEPLCTPLICQRLHVPSTVKGQVDHTISRRCAAEYAPAARILCSTLRHGSRRPGAPRTHRPVAASSCAFNAQCAPGTRCGSGRSRPRRHCPAPRLGPLRAHANTASVAEQRTRTVAWPPDRGRVLSASRAHLPAAARTRQPADIFAKQSLTPLTHAPPSQVTLRAGTSWSQVIDGVQCRVNVVRERGKLALMVTAGIGSGLDYDKFRIKCPRTPSRTHIASRIEDSSILSWKMHASLCKLPKFSPWLAPLGARGCKIFTPGGAPQKAPPKRTKLGFHCVT